VLDDSPRDLLFGGDLQFDSRNEASGGSSANSIVVDSSIVVGNSNTGGAHSTGGCKDNTEGSIGRVHTDSNMPNTSFSV